MRISVTPGRVEAVHCSPTHAFTKAAQPSISLIAGIGIEGDAHAGPSVRHRSRRANGATGPNLRQVHLIHGELHDELRAAGFDVRPGGMGENITTRGLDLLELPTGTVLRLGGSVLVALTGLRNPCKQLDGYRDGLLAQVLERADDGKVTRKAGVMGVVLHGGEVRPGDPIEIALPPGRPVPLAVV